MSLGKLTGRAADLASSTVSGLMGQGVYPETEYGLASMLFEEITQAERDSVERDRAYYLDLMRQCLAVVREKP